MPPMSYQYVGAWPGLPADPEDAVETSDDGGDDLTIKRDPSEYLIRRRCPALDPSNSPRLEMWDIFLSLVLIVVGFLSPFETAFLTPELDGFFVFDRCIDCCYVVDMVLQFFIAIPDPNHPTLHITDHRKIALNYFTGWFAIDFCSILPIDEYCIFVRSGDPALSNLRGLRNLKVIRLLRLVRLLRLSRFSRMIHRWHLASGWSYSVLSMVQFVGIALACCHWMACLWGGIAVHSCDDVVANVGTYDPHCVSWFQTLPASEGRPSPCKVYSVALYWAVITLISVGYGDITPQTSIEYWVCTLCISLSASLWAYCIGATCVALSTMDMHDAVYRQMMDGLNGMISEHCMPVPMSNKLRRYLQENRELSRRQAEASITREMSPKLRGELHYFMHKTWICKVWYLASMPQEVLSFVAQHLDPATYSPDEDIFFERTLFIVRSGVCARKGRVLVSGAYWGEDMLLTNDVLRDKTPARALTYASTLKLYMADLAEILDRFPSSRRKLRKTQLLMALNRGIQSICKESRKLQRSDPIKHQRLMETQWQVFIQQILAGHTMQEADMRFLGVSFTPTKSVRTDDVPSPVAKIATSLFHLDAEPEQKPTNVLPASLASQLRMLDAKAEQLLERGTARRQLSTMSPYIMSEHVLVPPNDSLPQPRKRPVWQVRRFGKSNNKRGKDINPTSSETSLIG